MEFSQLGFSDWATLMFSAFLQGMSKGGIPGLGILAVPFVAMVIPGKASTGLVLPMLVVGDMFALLIWRKSVSVPDLLRALPWALLGVLAGWRLLGKIPDAYMSQVIATTVLLILVIQGWRKFLSSSKENTEDRNSIGKHIFPAFMGSLGGITTMLANAAGPVIGVYLLSLRLDKARFLGTSAWFFFIVNWIKVPFMVEQNMITRESLSTNLVMVPALLCGVGMGVLIARRMKQRTFEIAVIVLASAACLKLFFS